MTQVIARPPRPKLMDPDEWTEVALKIGMKRREVLGFERQPNGEYLVTTKGGKNGEGSLCVLGVNGKARPYTVPAPSVESNEPWTLRHLDQAAEVEIPPFSRGEAMQWMQAVPGREPLRAWRWWKYISEGREVSMAVAADELEDCRLARRIILASRWLGAEDAAQL